MLDVLYIAILVAFFALMVGFVRLCERVVGKDDVSTTGSGVVGGTPDAADDARSDEPTSTAPPSTSTPTPEGQPA